jgi:hypothetical protein
VGFDPYKPAMQYRRRSGSAFQAPKRLLSRAEARTMVAKSASLSDLAENLAETVGPIANVEMATFLIRRSLKKRGRR